MTFPGGAYSTATKAGWKVKTVPTGMSALYKNAGMVVPLIRGIKKVKYVLKNGLGITKFNAVGKGGSSTASTETRRGSSTTAATAAWRT